MILVAFLLLFIAEILVVVAFFSVDDKSTRLDAALIRDMLVRVRVTPNAKKPRVTEVGEASFEVKVDEKAIGGRANKRLIEIVSEHLGVPKSRIVIVSGARSRNKVLEVVLPDDR